MRNFICKSILTLGAGLALAGTVATAAEAGRVTLHGHRPAALSQLSVKGHLTTTNNLNLAIGLPVRNQAALNRLLQEVYDPASPNYHKFLTPPEFTALFGPTEQDYQAVVDFARQNGLKLIGTHPNRMIVDVSGAAADVEKAFQVKLNTYRHPREARDFFATDTDPSVPAGLAIQDISGLDSYRRPHPHLKASQLSAAPSAVSKGTVSIQPANTKPHTGSGPVGSYMGNDFRNAYIPGSALNGAGQSVALVQFDGYYASDIVAYETLTGRTNIPLQNVLIDGFSGAPTGNGGEVEVSLDIEMALSMAPALSKIIVYEGDPYNFHPNDLLNKIATDDAANQISCSWGWTGGPTATTDGIFQQMALQGQSFFTASGDSDAYPAGTVDDPFGFGTPSDSAYVTSVGGTTLTMTPGGTAKVSETVWNWGIEFGVDGIGSSGGISTYYQIPYWQTNVSMTACQGSTTARNFPDVAMTADNVYVIADGGVQYLVGGTSCAAPLWAGFTSLINQQGTNSGHAAMGFLNPAFYHLAALSNYTNCFNDITTDNNKWSGSPNLFNAVTNYDLCTGLGTPNGTNLINALITGPVYAFRYSPPPAPYGTTMSAMNGGNPNGRWSLFVFDDTAPLSGIISNGWYLTLTLANPVGTAADLALTMTASQTNNVLPGSNVVFTITVTNYGYSTSSNVQVSVTLPTGATLVATNATLADKIILEGDQLSWLVTSNGLANGAGAKLALTVKTPAAGGVIQTYAIVQADTPDPNPDDDSALVSVNVSLPPAPQLAASFSGTGGHFLLTVTNSPGQVIIILTSTNILAAMSSWTPIYTNVEPFIFTNLDTTIYSRRFYRAITSP
jgi:uncharacterized repeat protein (TIGR01451 family)